MKSDFIRIRLDNILAGAHKYIARNCIKYNIVAGIDPVNNIGNFANSS